MSKTALITGGGRGIGSGIVEELAKNHWNVGFCGRKAPAEMAARCEELMKKYPVKAVYFQADISNAADRQLLLDNAVAEFGQIDALVNNAGVAPEVRADLLDMTEASFDRVLDINLKGPFFLTQIVGKYFAQNKIQGAIVSVGSISATVASISRGEYCISKAGIAMMTKLFAVKMAEFGVNVYEIRPGVIASDMTSTVKEKYDKLIANGLTLQPRWGQPEDIGKAVAALLNGALPYSTGQVINVDGGLEVQRL